MREVFEGLPLREKEERLKQLIKTDERYVLAYAMVSLYYETSYAMGKSHHYTVFKAIYADGAKKLQWKLAVDCNVARTTLFNYRNDIIKCFEICIEKVKEFFNENEIKEIAVNEIVRDKAKLIFVALKNV